MTGKIEVEHDMFANISAYVNQADTPEECKRRKAQVYGVTGTVTGRLPEPHLGFDYGSEQVRNAFYQATVGAKLLGDELRRIVRRTRRQRRIATTEVPTWTATSALLSCQKEGAPL